jgi:hypothetical protein
MQETMSQRKKTISERNKEIDRKEMGLDHPLDGVTNPKYKLLHFLTNNFFLQREEGTSF